MKEVHFWMSHSCFSIHQSSYDLQGLYRINMFSSECLWSRVGPGILERPSSLFWSKHYSTLQYHQSFKWMCTRTFNKYRIGCHVSSILKARISHRFLLFSFIGSLLSFRLNRNNHSLLKERCWICCHSVSIVTFSKIC